MRDTDITAIAHFLREAENELTKMHMSNDERVREFHYACAGTALARIRRVFHDSDD